MSEPDQSSIVREAIASGGLLIPEAEATIAALLASCGGLHPKQVATQYRKAGRQLTREEKRALGIRANSFMSHEALAELTDRGRKEPLEAHATTILCALFAIGRMSSIAAAGKHDHAELKYSATFVDCPGCQRLGGTVVEVNNASIFGPPDCNRGACALLMTLHIDFAAGLT